MPRMITSNSVAMRTISARCEVMIASKTTAMMTVGMMGQPARMQPRTKQNSVKAVTAAAVIRMAPPPCSRRRLAGAGVVVGIILLSGYGFAFALFNDLPAGFAGHLADVLLPGMD